MSIMAEEAPLILESYWEKFNRRLREEGLTQEFKPEGRSYTYPVPRNEHEWQIFLKILNELSR